VLRYALLALCKKREAMTNLLNIDLTSQRIWQEDVEALRRDYIGGTGINARLAYDLIPAGANPLGEENVLIFGVGPFVGTNIPTACRTEVTAKSPLTDLLGTSSSGLYWGAHLRYAGFDHIAVFGRACAAEKEQGFRSPRLGRGEKGWCASPPFRTTSTMPGEGPGWVGSWGVKT
jgi:hypothetical protein